MVIFLRLSFPSFTGCCLTCSTKDCLGQAGQVLDKVVVLVENKINHLMLTHPLPPQRFFHLKFLSLMAPLMFFKNQGGFFSPEYMVFLHSQNIFYVHSSCHCLFVLKIILRSAETLSHFLNQILGLLRFHSS